MSIGLRFKISMLANETDLMRKVHSFFGFGTLGINKDGTVDFMVKDLSNLFFLGVFFGFFFFLIINR